MSARPGVRLLEGDALVRMAELPADSIDACVTDPPYGLKFMGKAWDHGVPGEPYWREALRVLQPGGHLVAFGGTRTYHRLTCAIEDAVFEIRDCLMWLYGQGFPKGKAQLKPGWEPIVLARKPGPLAPLNIDGCRIEGPKSQRGERRTALGRMNDDAWQPRITTADDSSGRWPANVVLDEDAALLLDEQSGHLNGRGNVGPTRQGKEGTNAYGDFGRVFGDANHWHDRQGGGASRFYYVAKASPSERGAFNDHPTVKPLALMQWLVRLVTLPGGTVLDPFMGSGSTLLAASREGFGAIGIDSDPHAVEIARQRLTDHYGPLLAGLEVSA